MDNTLSEKDQQLIQQLKDGRQTLVDANSRVRMRPFARAWSKLSVTLFVLHLGILEYVYIREPRADPEHSTVFANMEYMAELPTVFAYIFAAVGLVAAGAYLLTVAADVVLYPE